MPNNCDIDTGIINQWFNANGSRPATTAKWRTWAGHYSASWRRGAPKQRHRRNTAFVLSIRWIQILSGQENKDGDTALLLKP